jgi:hypothetical protein
MLDLMKYDQGLKCLLENARFFAVLVAKMLIRQLENSSFIDLHYLVFVHKVRIFTIKSAVGSLQSAKDSTLERQLPTVD